MARESGFPSMTALLALLAVVGYQNRDKIAEVLGNLSKSGANPGSSQGGGIAANLPGALGGLLAGGSIGDLLKGGLGELMDKFGQAGQRDKVESWVGTGPNKDVAPTDLKSALGPNVLAELESKTGLSEQELLSRLCGTLPQAVDECTPQGRIA